jgi:ABC-type nitrate/sulfonate/bicarbonate transport system permease component
MVFVSPACLIWSLCITNQKSELAKTKPAKFDRLGFDDSLGSNKIGSNVVKLRTNHLSTVNAVARILPILILLSIWEVVARTGFLNDALFPSPSAVLLAFSSMLRSGELMWDTLATLGRAFAGFIIGSAIGIVFGLLTARVQLLNRSLGQIIHILRPIPPIALVPLAIVWLGLGEESKIGIITWGVFFPVWISTHVGVSSVDEVFVWAARSLGANHKRLLFRVILPATLTHIVAGMRVSVAIAFICVVVAEMSGAYVGLGYRINTSYLVFRVDRMIACLLVLGGMGALSDWAFMRLVAKTMPWYRLNRGNSSL